LDGWVGDKKLSVKTYQRNIPLFIASAIVALFILEFLIGYDALTGVVDNITTTATTVALFTHLFGITTLILMNSRRVTTEKIYTSKRFYTSIIILLSFAFFILLGLVLYPDLTKHPIYDTVYRYIIGYMGMATEWATWLSYMVFAILFVRVTSIESVAFAAAYSLYFFREYTLLPAIWPGFADLGSWLEGSLGMAGTRAFIIVAAVSAIITGWRVLVAREPGIIEEEAAE
jgi:hypothetical protein